MNHMIIQNPDIFQEAWNHPNEEKREHWRTAIKKEFNNVTKREIWRKANIKEIPKDRRLIGSKWVFKKKRYGIYRGILVGL